MIIITGATGTGKTFVAEAIAAKSTNYKVLQVSSVTEAIECYTKVRSVDEEIIFVCHGIVLSPAELGCSAPAYLIHMTKTR